MREGSSSSEVPLSLSPKPPPQASLWLRPPLLRGQTFASVPLAEPHLTPGATLLLNAGIPPTMAAHPPRLVPSEGRRTQSRGLLLRSSAYCVPTLRELGLGRHCADTVRPPGGVRGPLGDQPRPIPRPKANPAPWRGPAPPQPTVEAELGQMLGPAARLQPWSGGPNSTLIRRESPLERGSAPGGDRRCETGQPGRGAGGVEGMRGALGRAGVGWEPSGSSGL